MANAKTISYVDAVAKAAVADIRSVTEADLELALILVEEELFELRARLAKLEQGGDIPKVSDGKTE
jgi:ribosomal protein L29